MTYRHKMRLVNILVIILAVLIVALGFLVFGPGRQYLRAAALLQRIGDGHGDGKLADYDRHPVEEFETSIPNGATPIAGRLYIPRGVPNPPAMVVVHGIHRLGIQEPRLMAFSRAISASGIVVLTPELEDIADYRITEKSVQTIRAAAKVLHERTGAKVGVMGLSFAGGLSLIAASDAKSSADIGFVISVGGHHDLARVSEFLATDRIPHPDGTVETVQAHEYGALVLVYSHPEDFFSPADVQQARETLRLQLWEEPDAARRAAAKLSRAGRAKMELLLTHKKEALADELLASVRKHANSMASVSPSNNLSQLRSSVLLLHGVGDSVIPTSEILWLEREVAARFLKASLVTPILSHVDVSKTAKLSDKLELVRFIAIMMKEAERCADEAASARHARRFHGSNIDVHSAALHGGAIGYAR
ncbi:MAG TPA: hypothetical protein VD837_02235 [Terriglobales bacterium]|nr:hypothetical protein [Terriglobales bacterium]